MIITTIPRRKPCQTQQNPLPNSECKIIHNRPANHVVPTAKVQQRIGRVLDPHYPRHGNQSKDDRLDRQSGGTQRRRPLSRNGKTLDEHREDTQKGSGGEYKLHVLADKEFETPSAITIRVSNVKKTDSVDEFRDDRDA